MLDITTLEDRTTVIEPNAFDENSWSEQAPEPAAEAPVIETVEAPKPNAETTVVTTTEPAVPTVDFNKYVKEKFGYDSEEVALAEITKLKSKDTKFANEASEKFFNLLKEGKEDEVYSYLAEKKKLDKLATATIDNVSIAEEVVKLQMAHKYQGLTADEIDYKFKKMFAIPAMPKQSDDELDTEYEERMADWEQQKAFAEKELIIEAKLAKPDIEKLKSELILPELEKAEAQAIIPQEDLDLKAKDDAFKLLVPNAVKEFNGVTVSAEAKYGDVKLPINVSYTPSDDEKAVVLEGTTESMQYLAGRWFDAQGVASATKMAEDIFFLENRTAILSKVATEAAAQAFEHFQKNRSNIKLNGEQQKTYQPTDATLQQKMEDAIWDA